VLDGRAGVALGLPDMAGDGQVGQDVVEEDIGEFQAAAHVEFRRGRLDLGQVGELGPQLSQPPVGIRGRLRGLVHAVMLDRIADHAAAEEGVVGRPARCASQPVLDLGKCVAGCLRGLAGVLQLADLGGQPAAFVGQREQPGTARVAGLLEMLLLVGQHAGVGLRRPGQPSALAFRPGELGPDRVPPRLGVGQPVPGRLGFGLLPGQGVVARPAQGCQYVGQRQPLEPGNVLVLVRARGLRGRYLGRDGRVTGVQLLAALTAELKLPDVLGRRCQPLLDIIRHARIRPYWRPRCQPSAVTTTTAGQWARCR
jgi:hypothetical protein